MGRWGDHQFASKSEWCHPGSAKYQICTELFLLINGVSLLQVVTDSGNVLFRLLLDTCYVCDVLEVTNFVTSFVPKR